MAGFERRNPMDYQDPELFPLKWAFPIKFFVGIGVIIASLLPSTYSLALGFIFIADTIIKSLLIRTKHYTDPLSKRVIPGRRHATIEGDFVVFLIGARANRKIDLTFKWMGDSMQNMVKELEDNPSLGYLGSESFVGTTGTLLVQYWKTVEDVNAYAKDASRKHFGTWMEMSKLGKASPDYAFWHETYKVSAGNYENIYVNCPDMMLANCKDVTTGDVRSSGKYETAKGRMKMNLEDKKKL